MSLKSILEAVSIESAKLATQKVLLESIGEVLPSAAAEALASLRGSASSGLVIVLEGTQIGLKQALELLPAERAYAAVSGSFESPLDLELLTEAEMREDCRHPLFWPAYPVIRIDSSVMGAYFVWATRLRNGFARIELRNADQSDWARVKAEGLLVDNGHTSVIVQPLVAPVVKELKTTREAWDAKWAEFFAAQGYTEAQLQFGRAFSSAAINRTTVTSADLPEPAPDKMTVAEEDLAILRTGISPEVWPANSSMRALSRIGSFWGRFTRKEAERLLQFQQEMAASAPGRDSAHAEILVVLEKAKRALEKFNGDTWAAYRGRPPAEMLSNQLQAELGYPISVSYRSPVRTFGPGLFNEVWLCMQRSTLGASVRYKESYEKGDKLWFESPAVRLAPVSFIA
jgi:hypothetical protein